jgi:hypothetical protein
MVKIQEEYYKRIRKLIRRPRRSRNVFHVYTYNNISRVATRRRRRRVIIIINNSNSRVFDILSLYYYVYTYLNVYGIHAVVCTLYIIITIIIYNKRIIHIYNIIYHIILFWPFRLQTVVRRFTIIYIYNNIINYHNNVYNIRHNRYTITGCFRFRQKSKRRPYAQVRLAKSRHLQYYYILWR